MKVVEAAFNKLREAYEHNCGVLDVTITKQKVIDFENCKTDGDMLILAFTDGTTEKIEVCDYWYTSEEELVPSPSSNVIPDMMVEVKNTTGDSILAYRNEEIYCTWID